MRRVGHESHLESPRGPAERHVPAVVRCGGGNHVIAEIVSSAEVVSSGGGVKSELDVQLGVQSERRLERLPRALPSGACVGRSLADLMREAISMQSACNHNAINMRAEPRGPPASQT